MVRVLTGSQGRASAGAPRQFHGHAAGGWLRGIRCGVRNRAHSGSGLLGACAQKVLRPARRAQIAGRGRSDGTHRRAVCHRKRNSRPRGGRAARGPQRPGAAVAGLAETMAGRNVRKTIEKIRHGNGGALRALALGRIAALRERRPHRDRQQRRRTRPAHRRSGPQELLVRGLRCRRRTRRRDLQPDRHRQTQRSRPRSLSPQRAVPHRRPSDQPHRGTPALELPTREGRGKKKAKAKGKDDPAFRCHEAKTLGLLFRQ